MPPADSLVFQFERKLLNTNHTFIAVCFHSSQVNSFASANLVPSATFTGSSIQPLTSNTAQYHTALECPSECDGESFSTQELNVCNAGVKLSASCIPPSEEIKLEVTMGVSNNRRHGRFRQPKCADGSTSEDMPYEVDPGGSSDVAARQTNESDPDTKGGICQPIPPPPPMAPSGSGHNRQNLDPACDPDNPYVLQFQDVTSAAFMIRNAITVTPCVMSRLSRMVGMDVYLKKDFMQLTGSFKERGARYALLKLTPDQKSAGIITASLGNHALALACHGAQLNIPVTLIMPVSAPLAKVGACRAYGANVIIEGENMSEAKSIALMMANEMGFTYINGYDHPHILAGQGTLGLELLEQVCDIDAIIIPVGGGGLLAGVATAVKTLHPHIKIIAVESENCPSFTCALRAGKPVMVESKATIADGLAVPMVGVNSYASSAHLVDRTVIVKEDLIALAILRAVEVEKNVLEGAGAAGIAALMSGQLDDYKDKRVVVLVCGANIDVSMLGRCMERGLVADGRLVSFTVLIDQNPCSLSELFDCIARVGATVRDLSHEKSSDSDNFFLFPVKVVVETPGASASRELRTALSQNYKKISFHHSIEPIVSQQPMWPAFPKAQDQCNSGSDKRGPGSAKAERSDPVNNRESLLEMTDAGRPRSSQDRAESQKNQERKIKCSPRHDSVQTEPRFNCQEVDKGREMTPRRRAGSIVTIINTFPQEKSLAARCMPIEKDASNTGSLSLYPQGNPPELHSEIKRACNKVQKS